LYYIYIHEYTCSDPFGEPLSQHDDQQMEEEVQMCTKIEKYVLKLSIEVILLGMLRGEHTFPNVLDFSEHYWVALMSRIVKIIGLCGKTFAKEPYKRDNILSKRPIILSILLTVATPHDQRVEEEAKLSFQKSAS